MERPVIRICIIDDEFRARRRIAHLLEAEKRCTVVGEADNGGDAVELIDREKPDLVFLDIRMPGLSGFQVLQRALHRPAVIFVTAYDEHAVQAFEVHAVDYLLKPFPDERFRDALRRATERVWPPSGSDAAAHNTAASNIAGDEETDGLVPALAGGVGEALLAELQRLTYGPDRRTAEDGNAVREAETGHPVLERVPVRRGFEFEMVPVAGVDYFTVIDGLVFLVRDGRRVVVDHTLSELELRLDARKFMRVHRKSLVNINRVERVVPWGRGRIALHFTGEEEAEPVHVGRDRTQEVKRRLGIP